MCNIKTALVSVSDKSHLKELVSYLFSKEVQIISTGGTAKKLKEWGIPYTPIESITKKPEAFDGRVKTISFEIASGILMDRSKSSHIQEARDLEIHPIDLVVCNLYPFEQVTRTTKNESLRVENIDVGGPSMIRAAAKNFQHVSVLISPTQYSSFLSKMKAQDIQLDDRKQWAIAAFQRLSEYDNYICQSLQNNLPSSPSDFSEFLTKQTTRELRYGENPHQKACFIKIKNTDGPQLFDAKQLHGKELSYNNLLDMDSAWKSSYDVLSLQDSKLQAVSIVKHANPCGIALSTTQENALDLAWRGDPISAFGSIISFTDELKESSALFLKDKFVEVILAPSYSDKALEILQMKKDLRLIQIDPRQREQQELTYRSISGGLLASEEDSLADREFQNVTKASFSPDDFPLAYFGSNVCKHLKSNGICLVSKTEAGLWLTGAGMGQPNRLEALKNLCIPRFLEKENLQMDQSILISDAFFPFKDSITLASEFGIRKILQPGGSIRDSEVVQECNDRGIAMYFTGRRHFRH